MKRVAVFGASGFIGATFVERLLARRSFEVRPLIHTTGSAWRLARHGLALQAADLAEPAQIRAALEGCTHVVNCALGGKPVMFKGLENLLAAAREARVERFVHLSSIALFGEQAEGALLDDDSPAHPVRGQYSWVKLRQDEMVEAAARRGLPAVVICPAHVFGAYSPFLTSCVGALRRGKLALLEGGARPASYVDVSNLCQALELALSCREADGRRIVIEDGQARTWLDVARALAPLGERAAEFPALTREEARAAVQRAQPRASLGASARALFAHLRSPAMREVVKSDPLMVETAQKLLGWAQAISPGLAASLLGRASGARAAELPAPRWDEWSARAQSQSVRFTGARARSVLGYTPELSFDASMSAFHAWYRATHGFGGDWWPLLRELYL